MSGRRDGGHVRRRPYIGPEAEDAREERLPDWAIKKLAELRMLLRDERAARLAVHPQPGPNSQVVVGWYHNMPGTIATDKRDPVYMRVREGGDARSDCFMTFRASDDGMIMVNAGGGSLVVLPESGNTVRLARKDW